MKELEKKISVSNIPQDIIDYVNLKIASTKLALVENLSSVAGNAFRVVLCIVLGAIAFLMLSVAGILWLGELIDSMLYATLIFAGVYILAAIIIYNMRNKFVDLMIPMFTSMFFNPPKKGDKDDDE